MTNFADFVITADFGAMRIALSRLGGRMDRVGVKILPRVAKVMAQGVDKGFLQHGSPNPWEPLAPSTVKQRRRERARGKKFAAGDEDQLRVSDNLRSAATDVNGLIKGSAYRLDTARDIVQIGVDSSEIPYALAQQKGNAIRHIPAREYIVLSDVTREQAQDAAQREINVLAADFERGTI